MRSKRISTSRHTSTTRHISINMIITMSGRISTVIIKYRCAKNTSASTIVSISVLLEARVRVKV